MNDTADTEVGPPEESYSESMSSFRRAGLRPGRVNRMSEDGGNQALRSLAKDLRGHKGLQWHSMLSVQSDGGARNDRPMPQQTGSE
jgi:hypothetical protein